MRLIDADDAKRTYTKDMFDTEEDFERVNDVLNYAPTVDAVSVVRCKDCKHRTESGNCGHPRHHGILPSAYPYDFCSYGDRRVDHLALEAETTQIIDG